jgi:hypothetical protein
MSQKWPKRNDRWWRNLTYESLQPVIVTIFALVMGIGGIYVASSMYSDFTRFETEGGTLVMNRIFLSLYDIGGKWLPTGVILFLSGTMSIYAFYGAFYELHVIYQKWKRRR